MSQSTDFLRASLLIDSDGGRSKIIRARGAEYGLDHLEIITQSPNEREMGIATVHKVYTSEIEYEQA